MRRTLMSNDIPFIHIHSYHADVLAFSTTRLLGCSEGKYGAFNINPYCGDNPEHVEANHRSLADMLGIAPESVILPHQTHETRSAVIDEKFLAMKPAERQAALEGIDTVMTDLTKVCVGVSTADCIPLLLHDRSHHAVCAVHAGWRGTVARIAQKAVADMGSAYGTKPHDITAYIGPGISLAAFEVGDEVYEAFANAGFEMPAISQKQDKWHIDLPQCNAIQLYEAGVLPANIQPSGICTYASHETYFSARRLGTASGRIYNGIMLTQ